MPSLRECLARRPALWQNRSDLFCHFAHTGNICGYSDGVQVTSSRVVAKPVSPVLPKLPGMNYHVDVIIM